MATYYDQFYQLDPGNPPDAGEVLDPSTLSLNDYNNDDRISPTTSQWDIWSGRYDTVDGQRLTGVWRGDTITIEKVNGDQITITGDTFYLADGRTYFTPTDGTILHDGATFVSSTYVTSSTYAPVGDLGPECFVAGTLITTPRGEVPVEWLRAGDLVETLDAGPQPLIWTGGRQVAGRGAYAPVRFEAGVLGNRRPLLVSQQHRMMLSGWRAELACGAPEVLVAAKHLVNGSSVRIVEMPRLRYVHLLLDAHHVLTAEGAPCESLFPGEMILDEDRAIHGEIRDAWGAHRSDAIESMVTARQVARGSEVSLLAA